MWETKRVLSSGLEVDRAWWANVKITVMVLGCIAVGTVIGLAIG